MAAYAALVSLNFMIDHIQQLRLWRKPDLESVEEKVIFMQEVLQIYSQRSSQQIDQELATQITDACYAAEDLIESHMCDRILKKSRYQVRKSSVRLSKELKKLLRAFDSIKGKAAQMLEDIAVDQIPMFTSFKLGGITRCSPVGEINMVGFDEHLIEVMKRITSHAYRLQIHPIVGMGGLGKTTLARNVFDKQLIKDSFQIRLWGTVSQSYSVRDIFVSFLGVLGITSIRKTSTVYELGDRLHKTLSGRKYLIVLDDVWTVGVWDAMRRYFPDNSNGSRIILTTRLLTLASVIGSGQHYQLKFLSEAESWNLLRQIVFAEGGFPSAIEDIGRKIIARCKGLPLAIVVIGGLLAKSDMGRESWEYVERSLNSIVNSENDDYCLKVLSLSYDNLPLHLQPCFLYMGVFPEDSELRVSKLVKLWVAEGFIKPIEGKFLEDSAMEYLRDLVERNLIFVSELGFSGRMKTCRIHDVLRDLCIRKAQEHKFLCFRRFHSLHLPAGLQAKTQHNVFRSAIENEKDGSFLYPLRSTKLRFTSLKLLNELNVVDGNSPEKSLLLLSSRCVTLSAYNISTPVSLASLPLLWNLQTLLIGEMPGSEPIVLPYEIWEMILLRHLQVPLLVLPYPTKVKAFLYRKRSCVLVNMQTLSDVQNFEFSEEVLRRIPNIKKLKVTYTRDSEGMQWPFHLLYKLESLSFSVHKKVSMECISLPRSLKKLTMDGGEIPWKEMTIVGSLPHLESLHLQNDAFYGEVWVPNEHEFIQLKSLHLKMMSLERLEAENNHFPRLESLVLVYMWKMKEIPPGIGDISTLRLISLEFCSSSLVNSAEQIKEDQEEEMGISDIHVQHHLTCGARDQLEEKLQKDFSYFKAFLDDTSMERRKDKKLSKLARQMRDLMHEAEDIIDTFAVSQPAETRSDKYFLKLYELVKEVKIICTRVKKMYNDNKGKLMSIAADGVVVEANEVPTSRQDDIVGLGEEAKTFSESRYDTDIIMPQSYDILPYHLKACFLYLGMFPKNFEISAWKLTRMWIAEGFIQQKDGISLEDTSEGYLDDLVNKKLVSVDKRRRGGKVKTCRLDDMLRDFCIDEAGDKRENLFQEIKMSTQGTFDPPVGDIQKFRRLSIIHPNAINLLSRDLHGPLLRSLVSFSGSKYKEVMDFIPTTFKLLKLFELQSIRFTKFPTGMYELFHLRYIVVSGDISIIPEGLSKLWKLQTLIVETTRDKLEMKADIWKMNELRHLKTNRSVILPKMGKDSTGGEKLQSLSLISPESCNEQVLGKIQNVRKLGIHGSLYMMLMDGENGSFGSLRHLINLEKLTLLGELRRLPPPTQFPPNLRSLSLAYTDLDWGCDMSILVQLENLEVLKLKHYAFHYLGKSTNWETVDGGFRKLEVLYIEGNDLETWKSSKHHFPRLRKLELTGCGKLRQIPIELAEIPSFQSLVLKDTNNSLQASAEKIRKKKEEIHNTKSDGFKLSIIKT